jgi:hypothetical protein
MNRFGASVMDKNPLGTSLIGKNNSHWSYLLDTQGSLMCGNGWHNNGDGSFSSITIRNSYSPLDLYLMGMIATDVNGLTTITRPSRALHQDNQ